MEKTPVVLQSSLQMNRMLVGLLVGCEKLQDQQKITCLHLQINAFVYDSLCLVCVGMFVLIRASLFVYVGFRLSVFFFFLLLPNYAIQFFFLVSLLLLEPSIKAFPAPVYQRLPIDIITHK